MTNKQIIDSILKGGNYETMQGIYLAYGIDRVESALEDLEEKGIKVPHIIMDVRGPIIYKKQEQIIETLEAISDYETMKNVIRVIGAEKVERAIEAVGKENVQHIVFDALGPVKGEEAADFIARLESSKEMSPKIYEGKQEMVRAYGLDKTNAAVSSMGGLKNLEHIVADVLVPMNAKKDNAKNK